MTINIGAKNGVRNGLRVVIDVEAFDYAYFPRGGVGATLGLSDLGERNILRQEGGHKKCFIRILISCLIKGSILSLVQRI